MYSCNHICSEDQSWRKSYPNLAPFISLQCLTKQRIFFLCWWYTFKIQAALDLEFVISHKMKWDHGETRKKFAPKTKTNKFASFLIGVSLFFWCLLELTWGCYFFVFMYTRVCTGRKYLSVIGVILIPSVIWHSLPPQFWIFGNGLAGLVESKFKIMAALNAKVH